MPWTAVSAMTERDVLAEAREALAGITAAPDLVRRLVDELAEARQERAEAVSLRNRAYSQRDEERNAKEGNIRALNKAITERDEALAAIERVRALAEDPPSLRAAFPGEIRHALDGGEQ